jgi:hypothetical protein
MKKDKMEKQNPVYIKIEYGELLNHQKDLLSSEVFFLNLITMRKRINLMREEEILLKTKIKKSVEKMQSSLKKIEGFIPKVKMPGVKKKIEMDSFAYEKEEDAIDLQLKEIQEKLKALNL